MKWFNNLKIRAKLMMGFGAVIIMTAVLVIIAVTQLYYVNTEYETILDGAATRRGAANAVQSNVRGYRRVIAGSVMVAPLDYADRTEELDFMLSEAEAMRDEIWEQLDIFEHSANNQPGQTEQWRRDRMAHSSEARRLFDAYREVFMDVQSYARAGDHMGAYDATVRGRDIVNDLIALTDEMVFLANASMIEDSERISSSVNNAILMFIFIAIGIVAVAIIVALLIARVISRPVQNLVRLTGDVADGKLNINMDRSKLTKDEIGQLAGDMYDLVDTIKDIVDDLVKLDHEYNTIGDIDYRIDTTQYKNSFKEMIQGVNNIPENIVRDVMEILNGLGEINKGNFNVETRDLPGKKMVLPNAVRATVANIQNVNEGLNSMIEAAAFKGELNHKIDVDLYEGGWREIMVGLNNIAESVDAPLSEIRDVMGNLSRGDFSASVSGDYRGDFLKIKNAVNSTMSSLSSYVSEITSSLARVAAGDLTTTITRDFVGDFEAIKESLNNISMTLNKTMMDISAASDQVLSGAKQISTSAQELANGAQEQASSVEELNAAIDIINQQTRKNAEDAAEASAISNRSTVNAQEGNKSMNEMVTAMSQIKESSGEISKIIKTISDIAFQTNLLALNASVEAARAGEHGKGFSVVADEVRNLAGRSQESATDTTGLIETSNNRVQSGSGIAEETAKSLVQIVRSANEVSELVSNISDASKEQAEAIEQVSKGLAQISKVTQSNSAVSEETAAASEELNSQADLLQQLVGYFRL